MGKSWQIEGRVYRLGREVTCSDADGYGDYVCLQSIKGMYSNSFYPLPRKLLQENGLDVSDLSRGRKFRIGGSQDIGFPSTIDNFELCSQPQRFEKAAVEILIICEKVKTAIRDFIRI